MQKLGFIVPKAGYFSISKSVQFLGVPENLDFIHDSDEVNDEEEKPQEVTEEPQEVTEEPQEDTEEPQDVTEESQEVTEESEETIEEKMGELEIEPQELDFDAILTDAFLRACKILNPKKTEFPILTSNFFR